MKKAIIAGIVTISLVWVSCTDEKDRFVDLRTGENIELENLKIMHVSFTISTFLNFQTTQKSSLSTPNLPRSIPKCKPLSFSTCSISESDF